MFTKEQLKSMTQEQLMILLKNNLISQEEYFFKNAIVENDVLIEYLDKDVVSINIPSSIKAIGNQAFYNCQDLKKVVLPNTITCICEEAFSENNNLKEIVIPSCVERIESAAFSCCEKLSRVIIQNGVKEIYDSAFSCCKKIKQIIIPSSVEYVGSFAFAECSATIFIEDSSKAYEAWAYNWCEGIKKYYKSGEWHYDENGEPIPNQ